MLLLQERERRGKRGRVRARLKDFVEREQKRVKNREKERVREREIKRMERDLEMENQFLQKSSILFADLSQLS